MHQIKPQKNKHQRRAIAAAITVVTGIAATAACAYVVLAGGEVPYQASQTPKTEGRPVQQTASQFHGRLFLPEAIEPTSLQLVGSSENNSWGYPSSYPSGPGLRATLRANDFAKLNEYFEGYQKAVEDDFHKEYWLTFAASSLALPDKDLGDRITKWCEAYPNHFAPWFVRAVREQRVAWIYRGGKWAKDTSPEQFELYRKHARQAAAYFTEATLRNKRLYQAEAGLASIWRDLNDREQVRSATLRAVNICPSCFDVYRSGIHAAKPRWGGSYEEMSAIAAGAQSMVSQNPRLRTLLGEADLDRCNLLMHDKNYEEALKACDASLEYGRHGVALSMRSNILRALHRYKEATADAKEALAFLPQDVDAFDSLANAQYALEQYEEAGRTALAARYLNPGDPKADALARGVVEGVLYLAAGDQPDKKDWIRSLDLADLAVQLDPNSNDARGTRGGLILQYGRTVGLKALRTRAESDPNDFQALRAMGYMSSAKSGPDVLKMWNKYIEAHPKDWRGYIERSRLHDMLHHDAESAADDFQACSLGSWESCAYLQKTQPS